MNKEKMPSGVILIKYSDGKTEKREYPNYVKALEEQRKLLLNKRFMRNVSLCKVEPKYE